MKGKAKWVAVALAAVLVICIVALVFQSAKGGTVAEISKDGQLVCSIDLKTAPEQTITVGDAESGINIIEVQKGRIRVLQADCKNQNCVECGWSDEAGGRPIVCLPNRLVIKITGEGGRVDAVSG
ncbi:MAG: NusG domain II-containing protein [Oscillospiraceae bacterium]|nr:NusG domain II-containing protein [Oscillospiraceae bacterium]